MTAAQTKHALITLPKSCYAMNFISMNGDYDGGVDPIWSPNRVDDKSVPPLLPGIEGWTGRQARMAATSRSVQRILYTTLSSSHEW